MGGLDCWACKLSNEVNNLVPVQELINFKIFPVIWINVPGSSM